MYQVSGPKNFVPEKESFATETPQIMKHSEVTMERQLDQRLQHSCFSVCCEFCEIYKKAFMRHLRATARCILRNARHPCSQYQALI